MLTLELGSGNWEQESANALRTSNVSRVEARAEAGGYALIQEDYKVSAGISARPVVEAKANANNANARANAHGGVKGAQPVGVACNVDCRALMVLITSTSQPNLFSNLDVEY